MVHVDEQQVDVFNLLLPPGGLRTLDQDVNEVEEVDEDRVVELPQLLLPVDILGGVEPLDALGANEETHHLTHR